MEGMCGVRAAMPRAKIAPNKTNSLPAAFSMIRLMHLEAQRVLFDDYMDKVGVFAYSQRS